MGGAFLVHPGKCVYRNARLRTPKFILVNNWFRFNDPALLCDPDIKTSAFASSIRETTDSRVPKLLTFLGFADHA